MQNRKIGVLKTKDFEVIKVQMWFQNGSSLEPIKENGYVHLLEHIKIANNPFKNKWNYKQMLYGVTTKELLKLSYFINKNDLFESVKYFINNLLDNKFDKYIINNQKQQVINELKYHNSQRVMMIINKSIESIFKDNSLSNCSGGVVNIVEQIDENQLKYYNKKVFAESPFILTCVGDINHISLNNQLETLVCNYFNLKCIMPPSSNYCIEEKKSVISISKDLYSECLFTYILPGKKDDSYICTKVIEILLKNILCDSYNINIKLYNFYHQSLLMIYVVCKSKEEVKGLLKIITSKVSFILSEEEIKKAIQAFRFQVLYDNTSLTKKSDYYTESILYGYDLVKIISCISDEVLINRVISNIKSMISKGQISIVVTEDMINDEYITEWRL